MQAKLFTETKDGIPVHWELSDESLDELEADVGALIEWLDANEFKSHRGFGNGSGTAPTRPAVPAQRQAPPRNGVRQVQRQRTAEVPECCEMCGGDYWDNRDNKRNPKAPDFKCKDKDGCGAGGWIRDDGSVNWKI